MTREELAKEIYDSLLPGQKMNLPLAEIRDARVGDEPFDDTIASILSLIPCKHLYSYSVDESVGNITFYRSGENSQIART